MKLSELLRYMTSTQDVQLTVLINNAIPDIVTGVTYLEDSANGLDDYFDYEVAGLKTDIDETGNSYLAIYLKDFAFGKEV